METDARLIGIFLKVAAIEGLSENEKAVGDYIRTFLNQFDIPVQEDDSNKLNGGNSGNLIVRMGSGGYFVLLSHMDTARSTRNLKPVIKDDRICSDGATILGADNRAGIASILYAIEKASRDHIPMKDFTVVFTICEETTMTGSQNLALDKNIQMGFVLDSALRPGNFVCQSYGAQKFDVKVTGRASHSGIAPEKGINSISVAARAINRLSLGRIDDITTANIGIMNGGTMVNVVPEETFLKGEVRSLNPERVETIISEIRQQFTSASKEVDAKLEFNTRWEFKPYRLTEEMTVYQKISATLRNVGLSPTPQISPGGSDANSLNAKGIPTVNIGIGAQNPHSNDEFILLEDLQKTADIALELIKN